MCPSWARRPNTKLSVWMTSTCEQRRSEAEVVVSHTLRRTRKDTSSHQFLPWKFRTNSYEFAGRSHGSGSCEFVRNFLSLRGKNSSWYPKNFHERWSKHTEVVNFFCPFPVAENKRTQHVGILNIFREVIKTKEVINRETNQNRN